MGWAARGATAAGVSTVPCCQRRFVRSRCSRPPRKTGPRRPLRVQMATFFPGYTSAANAVARSGTVYTQECMGRIPGKHFLRNMVERRALVAQLVRRDFETRYKGSAAGWLWGVVHPLVMLASYAFVFQICLRQTLPAGSLTQNYTIFMFCGYLPWMLFQETVSRCANSLVEQSNLITKTVFPSEVVPVSIFLASLIHHLIGVSLVLVGSAVGAESRAAP